MAGVGTAWRKHHQVALHESTSTSHQQVRRVSSSSKEWHAFGGWQPQSVQQRLSGPHLALLAFLKERGVATLGVRQAAAVKLMRPRG